MEERWGGGLDMSSTEIRSTLSDVAAGMDRSIREGQPMEAGVDLSGASLAVHRALALLGVGESLGGTSDPRMVSFSYHEIVVALGVLRLVESDLGGDQALRPLAGRVATTLQRRLASLCGPADAV